MPVVPQVHGPLLLDGKVLFSAPVVLPRKDSSYDGWLWLQGPDIGSSSADEVADWLID